MVSASSASSSSRVSVAASSAMRLKASERPMSSSLRRPPRLPAPSTGRRWIGQHQPGVELLGLQHVVLEHLRHLLQRLARVAVQRHDALVRLLPGQALLRVERDRAAALAVHVQQGLEPGVGRHLADHLRGGPEGEVGLDLGNRELDRTVAEHLQDQRAVELDVALHQGRRRAHLAEQLPHRLRIRTTAGRAPAQQLLPGAGQPHQHAAHRQAVEDELVEFTHASRRLSPRA
jgi:hypothetical protein